MAQYIFWKLEKDFQAFSPLNSKILDKKFKCIKFENIVIEHLDPEKNDIEGLFFYKGLQKGKAILIPEFIPKFESKRRNDIQNKYSIKNKSFLIKKGKIKVKNCLIDSVFVNVNDNNEAELFCFNINSQPLKIMKINTFSIEEEFKLLKHNLSNYFDFKIKQIYFYIIFDFEFFKQKDFQKIIKILHEKKINFVLFDLKNLCFKDIYGNNMNITKGINDIKIKEIINEKRTFSQKNFELNDNQKRTIKEILRKAYKKLNAEFYFLKNDVLYHKTISNSKAFCITEDPKDIYKSDDIDTYMLYKNEDKKYSFIKLNKKGGFEVESDLIYGLCAGNNYDYYKIE